MKDSETERALVKIISENSKAISPFLPQAIEIAELPSMQSATLINLNGILIKTSINLEQHLSFILAMLWQLFLN